MIVDFDITSIGSVAAKIDIVINNRLYLDQWVKTKDLRFNQNDVSLKKINEAIDVEGFASVRMNIMNYIPREIAGIKDTNLYADENLVYYRKYKK